MEGKNPTPKNKSAVAKSPAAQVNAPEPADASGAAKEAGLAENQSFPISRVVLFLCLAIVGGGADLWSKAVVFRWRGLPGEQDAWWIVDQYFGIETAVNIGAVFGVGAGKGTLFAAFSVVAAIGICIWLFWFKAARSLWLTTALGLICGGIIGNLYDRLGMWWQPGYPDQWKSGVRDWILVRVEGVPLLDPWPNFNIADSLLVVGAGMLLFQSFFPGKFESIGQGSSASEPETEAGEGISTAET